MDKLASQPPLGKKKSHFSPKKSKAGSPKHGSQLLSADDMIGSYNIQHLMETSSMMPSPFQKKKSSKKVIEIEKWFPIGSKGRDNSQVKMVAQKIKTIDFDSEIPMRATPMELEPRSPFAMSFATKNQFQATLKAQKTTYKINDRSLGSTITD